MTLTDEQKQRVRSTFKEVERQAADIAQTFYDRLFEVNPQYRALFSSALSAQGMKLMQMITVTVASLDNPAALDNALLALGGRHVGYGVGAADYDALGAALLWTLEQKLGADWTPETAEAWRAVYGLLASGALRAYPAQG